MWPGTSWIPGRVRRAFAAAGKGAVLSTRDFAPALIKSTASPSWSAHVLAAWPASWPYPSCAALGAARRGADNQRAQRMSALGTAIESSAIIGCTPFGRRAAGWGLIEGRNTGGAARGHLTGGGKPYVAGLQHKPIRRYRAVEQCEQRPWFRRISRCRGTPGCPLRHRMCR
jgi:hypothetical protein